MKDSEKQAVDAPARANETSPSPANKWTPFDVKTAETMLPFRWQDMPSENYGSAKPGFTPETTLIVGGRKAYLDEFIQYNTYAGVLCGRPMHPEFEIQKAIKKAEAMFHGVTAKPFVIPPTVRFGHSRVLPWANVPPVATIALLCAGSDITVAVWFQDSYGLPTDPAMLNALAGIDLKANAVEWNP